MTEDEEEVKLVRGGLLGGLGSRAICGGLMRVVERRSVFEDADPRLVAGGGSSSSGAFGLCRRPEPRRQRPGGCGGYPLRRRVGEYEYWGRRVMYWGRGV